MRQSILRGIKTCGLVVPALALTVSLNGPAQAASYPDRDVTFVVQGSAGGGSDAFARALAKVMVDLNLVSRIPLIENRPGGSGAVAYSYVAQKKGNPYYIGTVGSSFFTTALLKQSPVTPADFTPLAAVALDPYILVVNAQSELKSMADLKKKGVLVSTTTGVANDQSILAEMVKEKLGVEIRVVPFGGSGEEMASLLGGHSDIMFGNPTEIMPQIQAGGLRPIAVSSPKRLISLPDVPTFHELGYDIELIQLRALVMPKGVPAEAVKFWVDVLGKVANSDEWRKNYLEKYRVEPLFLAGEELNKQFDQSNAMFETRLKAFGLIK